jgi:peptidoglycan/xylan/chitin deacetylase (PgdA/CDA1 family)
VKQRSVIPILRSLARGARLDSVARVANRRRLLIVTYHGLRHDSAPDRSWLLLPLSEFVKQMEYLRSHYDVVPLDEAVQDYRAGSHSRARACITFDDGYRNNLELALPVLQRLGLPATIFLPTGFIGTSKLLWTTKLELALRHASDADRHRVAEWVGVDRVPAASVECVFQISEALKTLPPARRDALLAKTYAMLPPPSSAEVQPFAFLTWPEVHSMEKSGLVAFGAHTVNHEIVRNLDDAMLREELATSIAEIARQCSRPSRVFAYPNGREADFDDRAVRILQELGCTAAVSTIEGLNDASVPPYALRRVSVGADMHITEFRSRVSGLDSQARSLVRPRA